MELAIKNFKPIFNVFKSTKNNAVPKYNINIKSKKDYNGNILKSIRFEKTISIIDALKLFIESPDILDDFSKLKIYSPKKDIELLIREINGSEKLKNKQTNNLIGCGYSSYVFDIGDDKVLKFTLGDHFNGRKPEFFDLPVQEGGKIAQDSSHYYYIEEKVSHDNITDSDIKIMEAQAGILDYLLLDCHSYRQFGRTKDGHLYLIDPECAEKKPNLWQKTLKQNFANWISGLFSDKH